VALSRPFRRGGRSTSCQTHHRLASFQYFRILIALISPVTVAPFTQILSGANPPTTPFPEVYTTLTPFQSRVTMPPLFRSVCKFPDTTKSEMPSGPDLAQPPDERYWPLEERPWKVLLCSSATIWASHVLQARAWQPGQRLPFSHVFRQNTHTSVPAVCVRHSSAFRVHRSVVHGCEVIWTVSPCALEVYVALARLKVSLKRVSVAITDTAMGMELTLGRSWGGSCGTLHRVLPMLGTPDLNSNQYHSGRFCAQAALEEAIV
jgi:hypothetical protein